MTQRQTQVDTPVLAPQSSGADNKQMWRLRWILITGLFVLFIGGLLIAFYTRNALFLSLPTSILLTMRPIVRFAFGQDDKHKKEDPS